MFRLFFLTVIAFGGLETSTYSLCFNNGEKCHSIFPTQTEVKIKGKTWGKARLSPKQSQEAKRRLDKIFEQASSKPNCLDPVDLVRFNGKKETNISSILNRYPTVTGAFICNIGFRSYYVESNCTKSCVKIRFLF